jgi:hypothetical protein
MHSLGAEHRVRILEFGLFGGCAPGTYRGLEEPLKGPVIGTVSFDPETQEIKYHTEERGDDSDR